MWCGSSDHRPPHPPQPPPRPVHGSSDHRPLLPPQLSPLDTLATWLLARCEASGPEPETKLKANRQWLKRTAVAAVTLLTAALTAANQHQQQIHHSLDDLTEHSIESFGCTLDVLGVPLPWGVSAAVHTAAPLYSNATDAAMLAQWAATSVADGLFLPIRACTTKLRTFEDVHACASELVLFVFLTVLMECRVGLSLHMLMRAGMCLRSDELSIKASCFVMRLVQLSLNAFFPSELLGYYLALQVPVAWPLAFASPPAECAARPQGVRKRILSRRQRGRGRQGVEVRALR